MQSEAGTYKVQRDRVTLSPRNGSLQSYSWRLGKDPSLGNPMLFLRDASGGEQAFYSQSSRQRSGTPSGSGKKDCGQMFVDCNIAGKPYSSCQRQFEACNAAPR